MFGSHGGEIKGRRTFRVVAFSLESFHHLFFVETQIFRIGAHEAKGVNRAGQFLETPFLNGLQIDLADAQDAGHVLQGRATPFPEGLKNASNAAVLVSGIGDFHFQRKIYISHDIPDILGPNPLKEALISIKLGRSTIILNGRNPNPRQLTAFTIRYTTF